MTTKTDAPMIAYLRVSTESQGRSGLGLEGQRRMIADLAARTGRLVVAEFLEVETGKGADALDRRPQLAAALKSARKVGGVIVVAKLDRLSRSVAFVADLVARGVPFVVAELPDASPFMLHVYAAVAEEERTKIAARTRDALAVLKSRGVKLGNPTNLATAQVKGAATNRDNATRQAAGLASFVQSVRSRGVVTASGLARELNAARVSTPTGAAWSAKTAGRLVGRLAA